MSYAKNRRGLLALAMAATFVAGCGTQQLGAPTGAAAPGYQSLAAKSDEKADKKHHKWLKFLKGIDLTDEQKQSLKTIENEFEPGVDHEDFRAWMSRAKALLTAETVNQEALGKLADEVHAEMNTFKSNYLDMLVDVRNVLTEEQRQKVADKLREKAEKKQEKDKKRDKKDMLEGLGLTEAQKEALKHEKTSRADKYKAMATFFLQGDRAALDAALRPDDLGAKVDRMVETLAGLSLETRKKLVERMEKAHEKMKERKREKAADKDKMADAADDDDDNDDDDNDDEDEDDDDDEDEDEDDEA